MLSSRYTGYWINRLSRKWFYLLLVLVVIGLPLVQTGVSIKTLTLFAAFFLWFNFLPGIVILRWSRRTALPLYSLALAAVAGIALSVLMYLLFLFLKMVWIYALIMSLMALGGLYLLWASSKRTSQTPVQGVESESGKTWVEYGRLIGCWLVLILVNCILWYAYYRVTPLPGIVPVEYFMDIPWHLGNIASLKSSWFPEDFRLTGYPFRYHFFAYAWMAVASRFTHIDSAVILLRLFPAFIFNLSLLTVWACTRQYKIQVPLLFLVVAMLAGNTFPFSPNNLYFKDLILSPTFLFAWMVAWMLIGETQGLLRRETGSISLFNYLPWLLLVVVLSGSKGPFLPVLIGGWGLAALGGEGLSRNRACGLTLTALTLFISSYFLLYRGGGANQLAIMPGQIIYNSSIYQQVSGYLSGLPGVGLIAVIAYLLAFLGLHLPGLIYGLRCSFERKSAALFLMGTALTGLILGYFLGFRDSSQYYFLFAAFPAMAWLTADGWIKWVKNARLPRLVLFILLIILSGTLIDTHAMANHLVYGAEQRVAIEHKALTPELYHGLTYLRDNSPHDAVVASNRFFRTGGRPVWFYYSAISERRMVLEGWSFMPLNREKEIQTRFNDLNQLYRTESANNAQVILNRYGINYLIADKNYKITQPKFPSAGLLKPIYENREIIIYQVINSKIY